MSTKNIPEISRINYFESDDVVQIFGENFDDDTKLYVWQAKNEVDEIQTDLSFMGGENANEYRKNLIKNRTVNPDELDSVESALPQLPPETAKIFKPDGVFDHCIYFGEAEPEIIDGKSGPRIPGGTSIFWLENENGISKPAIANRPQIWNTSFDKICKGDRIMLFGDSFGDPVHFSDGGNLSKRAAIKNTQTGECFTLKCADSTGYQFDVHKYIAEYLIPTEAPVGKYNIYVHSSTCGRYGWSEPVEIEITDDFNLNYYFRTKWNRRAGSNVVMPDFKIKTIFADDASPLADYADKIQSAIDSLTDGGVVALSYGTFPISAPITVRRGVVLKGAGNSTIIRACERKPFDHKELFKNSVFSVKKHGLRGWANDYKELMIVDKPGVGIRLCTESGIEDLRIELGGGLNTGVLVADDKGENADNVFLNKITIDSLGLTEFANEVLRLSAGIMVGAKTKDLVIWSCKCWALQPLYILPSRHTYAKIINNEFYCRPFQVDETMLSGLRHSIISNNLFADGRRAFVSNQGLSHNWIFQNRVTGVDRADGALEAYMSEHGNGEWSGHGIAFGKDYVDIDFDYDIMKLSKAAPYEDRFDSYGRFLFIFEGRGFAQYRKIVNVIEEGTKRRLVLDKPWNVIPDETSALSILFGTHHNLWVDNNTTLSNGHTQFIWGCGFENIVSGHCMEMAAGMVLYSYHLYNDVTSDIVVNAAYALKVSKAISVGVLAFNRILRCQTKVSGMGIMLCSNTIPNEDPEIWKEFNVTRGVFGNTVRNCAFDGSDDNLNYTKNNHFPAPRPIPAGIRMGGAYNRITRNYLYGYNNPIEIVDNCEGNIVSRNDFRNEKQRFTGKGNPIGRDAK